MGNRMPKTENTEIFTMRISKKLKNKLNELAKKNKYKNSASAVIRELIESASRWQIPMKYWVQYMVDMMEVIYGWLMGCMGPYGGGLSCYMDVFNTDYNAIARGIHGRLIWRFFGGSKSFVECLSVRFQFKCKHKSLEVLPFSCF